MATIGNTSRTGTDGTGPYALALPVTMPAGGGTVTSLSAFSANNSGANNVNIGLYTDNAGKPGVLLCSTGSLAEAVGGTPVLLTGSVTPTVVAAGSYWVVLANFAAGQTNGFSHVSGVIATGTLYFCNREGLPADNAWGTYPDTNTVTGELAAYATYTAGGGPGFTPKSRRFWNGRIGRAGTRIAA